MTDGGWQDLEQETFNESGITAQNYRLITIDIINTLLNKIIANYRFVVYICTYYIYILLGSTKHYIHILNLDTYHLTQINCDFFSFDL